MRDEERSDNKQIDSTIEVVAPENIAFTYQLAGFFTRAVAFAIDSAIIGAYVALFGIACSFLAASLIKYLKLEDKIVFEMFFCLFLINYMFAFWFWNATFEAFWKGRTLGKAMLGLRVLTTEGRPIGRGQALLRNVVRAADLALGPFLAVVFCANGRFARFGDLAAGTLVVVERRNRERTAIVFRQPEILRITAEIPVDFELSDSLRKTLALYVARRTEISPARRLELASPLVAMLVEKMKFPFRVNPDAFLCALFQWSLGENRAL